MASSVYYLRPFKFNLTTDSKLIKEITMSTTTSELMRMTLSLAQSQLSNYKKVETGNNTKAQPEAYKETIKALPANCKANY